MNPIKLVALFVVSLGLIACGSSDTSTLVDVFDGAALGCNVSSNGMTATELGNGAYTFNPALPQGAITAATGCTDSDTQSLLPELLGVSQSGAMVISPITTVIVEDVITKAVDAGRTESKLRAGVLTISPIALTDSTSHIVTILGLEGYKPTDPEQANYIVAAKADSTGSSVAAKAMRTSLAVSTLLKSVEVSAGAANARAAVAAVSKAIAGLTGAVDLRQQSAIEGVMTTAKGTVSAAVATSIQTASDSISGIVATISSTTGDIDTAIAATTTVSEFLNTATETTITNSAAIVQLTRRVEVVINVATNNLPTLSSIPSQSTNKGVTKTVSITASDSDGDSLTYTLTSDPVNRVSGSVSGSTLTLVPDSSYSGTATLTLKVSDGPSEASQTFSLTVIGGLSVPGGSNLITDNSGTASSLTSSVSSVSASAFSDSGTDYSNAKARSEIYLGHDGASLPLEVVDIILCITNKTAQSTIVNGKYLAVLDVNLCNNSGSNEPFMANMIVDTSRESNASDQISKIRYKVSFVDVRIDVVVKTEPTEGSPYGNMALSWAVLEPTENGSIKISTSGNNSNIEYVVEIDNRDITGNWDDASTPYHDSNYLVYLDSLTSSDGSSGMAKVGYVDRTDSTKKLTYLLNWNSGFIAQYDYNTSDTLIKSTCKSRTAFTDSVENYALYNVDGSALNITTHVYGHYTDSSNNQKAIYVSKRNAWFDGGETGDARPTSMTTDDGTSLSISYDTDDSGNYDSDNDGTFATVIGVTLSDPIRFTNAVISGSNVVYNDGTTPGTDYIPSYMGSDGKYLWGIPWADISGNSLRTLNIKDGTQLTDMNGNDYILKQSLIRQVPNTVSSSNCTTLTPDAVNAETNISAKTSADITAIDSSWVTPVVGDNPRVIDGVIQ